MKFKSKFESEKRTEKLRDAALIEVHLYSRYKSLFFSLSNIFASVHVKLMLPQPSSEFTDPVIYKAHVCVYVAHLKIASELDWIFIAKTSLPTI